MGDRRVTAEMCRKLVEQNFTDEQAELVLDHLYSLASVVTDALLEHQEKSVPASGVCLVQFDSEPLIASPVRVA